MIAIRIMESSRNFSVSGMWRTEYKMATKVLLKRRRPLNLPRNTLQHNVIVIHDTTQPDINSSSSAFILDYSRYSVTHSLRIRSCQERLSNRPKSVAALVYHGPYHLYHRHEADCMPL
jgi:hypothetical protein